MPNTPDRYDGKPFLRLLDTCILDLIGQLEDEQQAGMRLLEPRLRETYKTSGTWQEIVHAQMELPPSFVQGVQRVWQGYLEAARSQGLSVHPFEFVERFVDENFFAD